MIRTAKSRKKIADDFIEGLMDSETRHGTSADAPDLVAAMANGSLTAVQVVTVYCKRAAFSHQPVLRLCFRRHIMIRGLTRP